MPSMVRPLPRGYRTLRDAVAAHRIDAAVARTLGRKGAVDAIVTVDFRSASTPAAPAGRSLARVSRASLKSRIERMASTFTTRERRALDGIDGAQVLERWPHLPTSFVHFSSARALLKVARNPEVVSVSASRTVRAVSDSHLSYVRQVDLAAAGHTGAGTYVAVLDTGVDYVKYGDFGSCPYADAAGCTVKAEYESAGDDGQRDDPYKPHGSNVAAIVHQVAPQAGLLSFDVFTGNGDGAGAPDWAIHRALETLVQRQSVLRRIVAANLSIGGATPFDSCQGGIQGDLATLRQADILPVISAGNGARSGLGAYGIAYPGCLPEAITVGATYDANVGSTYYGFHKCGDDVTWADKVTCFSQTGSALDVLAPGADIAGGGGTWTGTSQAAPHVAGALAVLAAARPAASTADLESAVVNSGPMIRDLRYTNEIDRRRLDLVAALNALATIDRTAPTVSSPVEHIAVDYQATNTTVPVEVSWSASDASGIQAYDVYVNDDGTWYQQTQLAKTATKVVLDLSVGHRYYFAVRAQDNAGNWSGWVGYNDPVTSVEIVDDAAATSAWTWAGSWKRYAWSSDIGGTDTDSATTNDWARFTFSGREAAWIAPKYHAEGAARVWYGNTPYNRNVDLYSATDDPRRVVFAAWGVTSITLQVVGTPGHSEVDVDAFAILR
jgi:subtilisin family serine protease